MIRSTCFLLLVAGWVEAEDIFTNQFESLVVTRVNNLELKDPHLFFEGFGCNDITDVLNSNISNQIQTDTDGDGALDINLLRQFKTDQPVYLVSKSLNSNLIDGSCAEPLFSSPCTINQILAEDIQSDYDDISSCLSPVVGSTSAYDPAVESTQAPCFSTEPTEVIINLNGISIPLDSFQQASRYQGGLILDQGLLMGFVSEDIAESIVIPAGTPLVGGSTLFDLLPGGGSCSDGDDRDIGPDGVTSGWWFYFNSTSDLVELASN